jgi:dolichol-phosphate hexosyltransferase
MLIGTATPGDESLRYLVGPDANNGPAGKRPESAMRLSILVPVYNEERTLRRAVKSLLEETYPVEVELCVVDDGSTDATREILERTRDPRMRVKRHARNLGKGAALMTAGAMATGTHMVPFDADLEYSAGDLPRMLAPIIEGRSDVVFGTRLFGVNTRYQSMQHALGNRALTLATNVLFNAYLSDVHTCLKMMPLPLFRALDLREPRFGLDAEITARILQLGIRPFEVSVSYYSRSVADGKKITWRDGIRCLRVLSRVRRTQAVTATPRSPASDGSTSTSYEMSELEAEGTARAVAPAP